MPKYQKPSTCQGCPLEHKPSGFIPARGPETSSLLFLGEAGGWEESQSGLPFSGPSGQKLKGLAKRGGVNLDDSRVHNLLSCQPPGNELRGASYEKDAIAHCKRYLEPTLREGHKVIVAVGAVPARNLLQFSGKNFKLDNWHGCPEWIERQDGSSYWVVPTYHPSFILRGNQKLSGVVAFDIARAKALSEGRWSYKKAKLVIDPDLEWFKNYVDQYLALCESGSEPWITVDIETIGKMSKAEDELEQEYDVIAITRVNFAFDPDLGVTVPWIGGYKEQIGRILRSRGVKLFWNWRFDIKILKLAGYETLHPWHDGMNMAKVLQSDLPQGLGFWASFYDGQAWKHLNESNQAEYAAHDGYKTLRVGLGLRKDLQSAGQWDTYLRHVYDLDRIVLHPAEEIGLMVDTDKLAAFKAKLEQKQEELDKQIQSETGEDARPWIGERKTPAEGFIEREVEREIWVCIGECKQVDVTEKHKCKKPKEPKIKKERKKRDVKPKAESNEVSEPKPRRRGRPKKDRSASDNNDPSLLPRDADGAERSSA